MRTEEKRGKRGGVSGDQSSQARRSFSFAPSSGRVETVRPCSHIRPCHYHLCVFRSTSAELEERIMGDLLGQPFGNYRLVRLLGQGAQASVYLAQHRYLG